ncbi:MAG: putative CoA-binding protein [Arcticibacterium sp.]|jgi:predicted CoA-binding protein
MDYKKTLILGASNNPSRYSFTAAQRLTKAEHPIVLVGVKRGEVAGQQIIHSTEGISNIHTVTVYLSQKNQTSYEGFILALKPKRVIFNPGAENPGLMQKLAEQGVEAVEACTLVMLGTGQF